jgi:hypothetical protein
MTLLGIVALFAAYNAELITEANVTEYPWLFGIAIFLAVINDITN